MPKPVVNQMEEQSWAGLTPKQRWDVMVSLRGPDLIGSETLKWYTTGVIRAAVHEIVRPEGGSAMINWSLGFVTTTSPGLGMISAKPKFDSSHFLHHVGAAAGILGIPTLNLPSSTFWAIIGSPMDESMAQLAEWVDLWRQACPSEGRKSAEKMLGQLNKAMGRVG